MVSPKIVIFKEKDVIKVTASVDPIGPREDKLRLTLKDILVYLESEKVKHGDCLKSDVLTNGEKSKNIAEWVFENPGKQKRKPLTVEASSGNVFKDIECEDPEEKLDASRKKTSKSKSRKKKISKLGEELADGIKEIKAHNAGEIELKTTTVITSDDKEPKDD